MGKEDKCVICGKKEKLHEHHTSYRPEETIILCEKCHRKVHSDNGFHNELKPDDVSNRVQFKLRPYLYEILKKEVKKTNMKKANIIKYMIKKYLPHKEYIEKCLRHRDFIEKCFVKNEEISDLSHNELLDKKLIKIRNEGDF